MTELQQEEVARSQKNILVNCVSTLNMFKLNFGSIHNLSVALVTLIPIFQVIKES